MVPWLWYLGAHHTGMDGINGPFVDVMCIDAGLQRPSYQLRNGTWRGFWMDSWPKNNPPNCTWPCHKQRLVGMTAQTTTTAGHGVYNPKAAWAELPTGKGAIALANLNASNNM